ncbi:hypothetical protein FKM82_027803 [Ascaphus truei]
MNLYLRIWRVQRARVWGTCSHCSGMTAEPPLTLSDQPDGVWTPLKVRDFSHRLQWRPISIDRLWRRNPIDFNGGDAPLKVYGGGFP